MAGTEHHRSWPDLVHRHGLAVAVLLVLALLWGLVLWFSSAQRQRLLAESERALQLTARALAEQTNGLLRSAAGDLHVVAQWLHRRPRTQPADDGELAGLLRAMGESNQGRLAIGLLRADGQLLLGPSGAVGRLQPVAHLRLDPPAAPADGEAARAVLLPTRLDAAGSRHLWPLLRTTGPRAGEAALREADGGPQRIAAVVALIDLGRLMSLHETLRPGSKGVVALIRSDGVVVTRVPELPGLIGRNLSASSPEIADQLARAESSAIYDGSATDRVRRVVAYRQLEDFPVSVVVAQAVDEALASYQMRRAVVLGICVPLTAIIVGLTVVLSRAQRRARVRQAELATVSDAAPIGMFRAGTDGQVTYANDAFLQIHQLRPDQAAEGWLTLLPPEKREAARVAWQRALAKNEPLHVQRRLRRPDGSSLQVSVQSSPVVVDGRVVGHVGTVADITEQARAEKAMRTLNAIFDATTDFVVQTDTRGRMLYMNPAARRRLGLALDAPIDHLAVADINPPATLEQHQHEIVPTAVSQGVWIGESIQWDAQHREVPVSHVVIAHRGPDGRVEYFSAIMRDISAEKASQQARQRSEAVLRSVAETIPAIVAVIDHEQRYRFANSAFERWRGLPREQLVGRTIREVLGEADYERSRPAIERALAGDTVVFERSYALGTPHRHMKVSYIPLRLPDGTPDGFVGVVEDITEHRDEEARLRDLTRIDTLTGALNRAGFEHALAQRAAQPMRPLTALLFIDLDRFKQVNDQHGHPAGDALLRAFAQRLRLIVRGSDAVARLGGDEFTVVLDDVKSRANAEQVAAKVLAAARAPVGFQGLTLEFGASVGIALWPPGDPDWQAVIAHADELLYRAKAAGRDRYALDSTF